MQIKTDWTVNNDRGLDEHVSAVTVGHTGSPEVSAVVSEAKSSSDNSFRDWVK